LLISPDVIIVIAGPVVRDSGHSLWMVIDYAVPGIQQQVQERVRVHIRCPSSHLEGQ
jgi:hypothetical protein